MSDTDRFTDAELAAIEIEGLAVIHGWDEQHARLATELRTARRERDGYREALEVISQCPPGVEHLIAQKPETK